MMMIWCLLAVLPLSANEEPTSLSSTAAYYNGNILTLQGAVVLAHGLGKMSAETAELERQDTDKNVPFSLIRLRTQVELLLKDRGQLKCQDADLDFEKMKGFLRSGPKVKVSYLDQNAVAVTSNETELTLLRQGADAKRSTFDIDILAAKGDVVIHYGNGFSLTAPEAVYYKHSAPGLPQHQAGLIVASPSCRLTRATDVIDAREGHLFVEEKQLILLEPKGSLGSSITNGTTQFTCGTLTWDDEQNQLLLKDKIHIQDTSFGTMDAEDELILSQGIEQGKRVLATIEGQGNIRLSSASRCCLADHVHFSRATHKMILSALPGKKVLFWDTEKKMHLAVPELHITIDPETGSETVQGIGAVRFEFTAEENSLLQKTFAHLKDLL